MSMYYPAKGVVGRYYKTETGMEEINLDSHEGEFEEGFEQINPNQRRRLVRKRISHSMIVWALPADDYRPMSHREDGALF